MEPCGEQKQIYCEWQGKIIAIVIVCKDEKGHIDLHQGDLPIIVPAEAGAPADKKTALQTFYWEQA